MPHRATHAHKTAKTVRLGAHKSHVRTIWELGILFVLLLFVFAPDLVRMLGAIAPLIPAPQPAFIWPLTIVSSSYSLGITLAGITGTFTSPSYNLSLIVGEAAVGSISSQSYNLTLGTAQVVLQPSAIGPQWEAPSGPSQTIYAAGQSYEFRITWTSDVQIIGVRFELTKGGATVKNASIGTGVTQAGNVYSVSADNLAAGNYTYKWTATDQNLRSGSVTFDYNLTKAKPVTTLLLNGANASITVGVGERVNMSANSTGPAALTTNIWTKYPSEKLLNASTGTVRYALVPPEPETYWILATTVGNENWTDSDPATLWLYVRKPACTGLVASPLSPTAYASDQAYEFKSNWTGLVSDVRFEWAGTNYSWLQGGLNKIDNTYNKTFFGLGAGNYTYRWWARDTDTPGNWYPTPVANYTILRVPTATRLWLNVTEGNRNYDLNEIANFTADVNVTGRPVYMNITKPDGSSEQLSSVNNISIARTLDTSGSWRVRAFTTDENYVPSNATYWAAVGPDTTAPVWSDQDQSAANPSWGATVALWASWSDILLDYAGLETNETGTWRNASIKAIGQPTALVNFSWVNDGIAPGTTVGWRIWANDSRGNYNVTDNMSFTVQVDTAAPVWSAQSQSNATPSRGNSVALSTRWSDNARLAWAVLETNETGSWKNYTGGTYGSPMALVGAANWSNFTWLNDSAELLDKTIGWRIWANDSSGISNVTPIMAFTVQAPPPLPIVFTANRTQRADGTPATTFVNSTLMQIGVNFTNTGPGQNVLIIATVKDPNGVPKVSTSVVSFVRAGDSIGYGLGFALTAQTGIWNANITAFSNWPAQGGRVLGTPVSVSFTVT